MFESRRKHVLGVHIMRTYLPVENNVIKIVIMANILLSPF